MNLQVALFKISMIGYYILRLSLIVSPLTILTVYSRQGGWKYGFTFIQNSLEVGIFGAFSVGFVLALYHALSFEMQGEGPMENYLKTKQKVYVKGTIDVKTLQEAIEKKFRVRDMIRTETGLKFKKVARFMKPDQVEIKVMDDGRMEIISQPFTSLLIIDFARNFKNVKEIAKLIK